MNRFRSHHVTLSYSAYADCWTAACEDCDWHIPEAEEMSQLDAQAWADKHEDRDPMRVRACCRTGFCEHTETTRAA